MDMVVDKGKTRLLYLPGWLGGMVLFLEGSFWTLHVDPLLSLVLGIVPVYFFGQWFTQNIFAQSPLVATSPCPECPTLLTVYFGDLFSVQTDGIINGKPSPPQPQAAPPPPPTPMRPAARARPAAWRGVPICVRFRAAHACRAPHAPQIECVCGTCKATLIADREQMLISTLPKKI